MEEMAAVSFSPSGSIMRIIIRSMLQCTLYGTLEFAVAKSAGAAENPARFLSHECW